jgi:hypothetical protein
MEKDVYKTNVDIDYNKADATEFYSVGSFFIVDGELNILSQVAESVFKMISLEDGSRYDRHIQPAGTYPFVFSLGTITNTLRVDVTPIKEVSININI